MVYSYEDDKLAKTRIGLFLPTQATNYQIKINVNYIVSDPALIGQKVNAIMKLRSPDGTILKTSSFPSGFDGNQTGTAQMLTNIPKIVAQNITTEIVFTDLNKTNVLSNIIISRRPGHTLALFFVGCIIILIFKLFYSHTP